MGEEVQVTRRNAAGWAERESDVKVAATYPLDRAVIVRNWKEVRTEPLWGMTTQFTWQDAEKLRVVRDAGVRGVYYYAKVYQRDRNIAWARPMWMSYR